MAATVDMKSESSWHFDALEISLLKTQELVRLFLSSSCFSQSGFRDYDCHSIAISIWIVVRRLVVSQRHMRNVVDGEGYIGLIVSNIRTGYGTTSHAARGAGTST